MDLVYEPIKKADAWFRGVFPWNCPFPDLLGGGTGDAATGVLPASSTCSVISPGRSENGHHMGEDPCVSSNEVFAGCERFIEGVLEAAEGGRNGGIVVEFGSVVLVGRLSAGSAGGSKDIPEPGPNPSSEIISGTAVVLFGSKISGSGLLLTPGGGWTNSDGCKGVVVIKSSAIHGFNPGHTCALPDVPPAGVLEGPPTGSASPPDISPPSLPNFRRASSILRPPFLGLEGLRI